MNGVCEVSQNWKYGIAIYFSQFSNINFRKFYLFAEYLLSIHYLLRISDSHFAHFTSNNIPTKLFPTLFKAVTKVFVIRTFFRNFPVEDCGCSRIL